MIRGLRRLRPAGPVDRLRVGVDRDAVDDGVEDLGTADLKRRVPRQINREEACKIRGMTNEARVCLCVLETTNAGWGGGIGESTADV